MLLAMLFLQIPGGPAGATQGPPPVLIGDVLVDAPGWQLVRLPHIQGLQAIQVEPVGDVTGDGRDDVAVLFANPQPSCWSVAECANKTFAVVLYPGAEGGLADSPLSQNLGNATPFVMGNPVSGNRNVPFILAGARTDFDGDGYADVVLTPAGNVRWREFDDFGSGEVQILFGGPDGLAARPTCRLSLPSLHAGPKNSTSVRVGAGDFRGEGRSELLLFLSFLENVTIGRSELLAWSGGSNCSAPWVPMVGPWGPSAELNWTYLGGSADINGDKKADLLIFSDRGSAVVWGSPSGLSNGSAQQINVSDDIANSAFFPLMADVEGDGFHDFVSAPACEVNGSWEDCSPTAIVEYAGGPKGLAERKAVGNLSKPPLTNKTLYQWTSTGDANTDGRLDIFVGQTELFGGNWTGYPTDFRTSPQVADHSDVEVSIFFGRAGGYHLMADAITTISFVNESGGWPWMALATQGRGDLDGDGFADFVLLAGPLRVGNSCRCHEGDFLQFGGGSALMVYRGPPPVEPPAPGPRVRPPAQVAASDDPPLWIILVVASAIGVAYWGLDRRRRRTTMERKGTALK